MNKLGMLVVFLLIILAGTTTVMVVRLRKSATNRPLTSQRVNTSPRPSPFPSPLSSQTTSQTVPDTYIVTWDLPQTTKPHTLSAAQQVQVFENKLSALSNVQIEPGDKENLLQRAGYTVIKTPAIDQVKNLPGVKAVQPVYLHPPAAYSLPNDHGGQWHLVDFNVYSPHLRDTLNWEMYWQTYGGNVNNSVTYVVLDTGFPYLTMDDKPNPAGGLAVWNSTSDSSEGYDGKTYGSECGHGTYVLGTTHARTNNGTGIVGLIPNMPLISIKIGNKDSGCSFRNVDMAHALFTVKNYLDANPTKKAVINMSTAYDVHDAVVYDAIQTVLTATDRAVIFTASGNEIKNIDNSPSYPCSYSDPQNPDFLTNLYCVSAMDKVSQFWTAPTVGSNWGRAVDFICPGAEIYTLNLKDRLYIHKSGTSLASPLCAGVFAAWWDRNPAKSRDWVYQTMAQNSIGRDGGVFIFEPYNSSKHGQGLPQLPPAQTANPSSTPQPPIPTQPQGYGDGGGQSTTVYIPFVFNNWTKGTLSVNSRITIANKGTSPASVTITYKDTTGTVKGTQSITPPIPPSSSRTIVPSMNVSGGRGMAVVTSSSPVAAVAELGSPLTSGTAATVYESYEGVPAMGAQVFFPNAFKSVSGNRLFTEYAIVNTGSQPTTVVAFFSAPGKTVNLSIPAGGVYYYDLEKEPALVLPASGTGVSTPVTFTNTTPQSVTIVSLQYTLETGKLKAITKTVGFSVADQGKTQYLPNILSKLTNGMSVSHFVENVSDDPISVKVSYKTDTSNPATSKQNIREKTASLKGKSVYSLNPATDSTFPTNWVGSARAEVTSGLPSIVAFTNQRSVPPSYVTSGSNGKGKENTTTRALCPLFTSGIPSYSSPARQTATIQVQNVSGQSGTTSFKLTFRPSVDSPAQGTYTVTTPPLADGDRKGYNTRVGQISEGTQQGPPANWKGSVLVESTNGRANVAAVVNLFEGISGSGDLLGSYNCVRM